MNRIVVVLLLCVFVFSTLLICIFQPKTHKHIMFENRNFKLELLTQKSEASKIEVTLPEINISAPTLPKVDISVPEIPSVAVPSLNIKTEIKSTEKTPNQNNNKEDKKTLVKTDKTPVAKQEPVLLSKNYSNTETTLKLSKEYSNNIKNIEQEQIVLKPQQVETESKQKEENTTQNVLTEQELEIIAWNKWRSDLQNKLMQDSKISAPIGTTFFFSFTVDKFGNITNLKTWSDNPSYTQLAVRIIKPLLLSYQHTEILTFPQNSKRIVTNADGSFTMAYSSKYSSPSDYNDYERIVK